MASINFPSLPTQGQVFNDPVSGSVFVCIATSPTQWTGSGVTTSVDNTYLRLDAANDPMTADLDTLGISSDGQVVSAQKAVNIAAWDLSLGNNWSAGAIPFPQPTNGVTGQSGLLTMTAAPTSWPTGGALKYPGGVAPNPTSFPAMAQFYVKSPTEVLLGAITEGIT